MKRNTEFFKTTRHLRGFATIFLITNIVLKAKQLYDSKIFIIHYRKLLDYVNHGND